MKLTALLMTFVVLFLMGCVINPEIQTESTPSLPSIQTPSTTPTQPPVIEAKKTIPKPTENTTTPVLVSPTPLATPSLEVKAPEAKPLPLLERKNAFVLNAGENEVGAMMFTSDRETLYVATSKKDAKLVAINLSTGKTRGYIDLPCYGSLAATVNSLDDRMYVATVSGCVMEFQPNPLKLLRISKSIEQVISSVILGQARKYLYAATYEPALDVIRVENFGQAKGFKASGESLGFVLADESGQYAYFLTAYEPGKIRKIHLTDMKIVNETSLQDEEKSVWGAVVDSTHTYAYIILAELDYSGTSASNLRTVVAQGRVVKFNLRNFTRENEVTLPESMGRPYSAAIAPNEEYIYVGTESQPAQLLQIRTQDLNITNQDTLKQGEAGIRDIQVHPDGKTVYVGTGNSPAKIIPYRIE